MSLPKGIVIDTDVGIDDALSIIVALRNSSVPVVAFTIVEGNVDVPEAYRNAVLLKSICGQPHIPVYPGAHPLIQGFPKNRWPGHGKDGLGDFSFTEAFQKFKNAYLQDLDASVPSVESLSMQQQAASALVDLVKSSPPNTIQIIALGPLTNLALAIKLDPTFLQKCHSVVVMGGCLFAKGNVSRTAEFNIHYDPEAAHIVLNEAERVERLRRQYSSANTHLSPLVTLVPWETTVEGGLPWSFYDQLVQSACNQSHLKKGKSTNSHDVTCIAAFIHGITTSAEKSARSFHDHLHNLSSRNFHEDYLFQAHSFVMPDLHAVLVALYGPKAIHEYKDWDVQVELQGIGTRGMTHVEWWGSPLSLAKRLGHTQDDQQSQKGEENVYVCNARIISKMNVEFVQEILSRTFEIDT